MKRILQQTLTFLVLLILLTIARFPYSDYVAGMVSDLGRSIKPSGVILEVERTEVSFPGSLTFKNVSLVFPVAETAMPVLIDEMFLDPSLLSLLVLRLGGAGKLSLYGGSMDTELSTFFWGSTLSAALSGNNLDLSRHPVLNAFGIHGLLQIDTKVKLQSTGDARLPYRISESTCKGGLAAISYDGGYKVAGLVPLPKLAQGSLSTELTSQGEIFRVQKLQLNSSWGTARGAGSFSLSPQLQFKRAQLTITIDLSTEGLSAFGGYLALAAQLPPDQAGLRWQLNVNKAENARMPSLIVKALH